MRVIQRGGWLSVASEETDCPDAVEKLDELNKVFNGRTLAWNAGRK
jgi:hypothetical protein